MKGFKTKKADGPKPSKSAPSLLRKQDKIVAFVFLALFFASMVAYWYLQAYRDLTGYTALPVMATPFFVIGVAFYIIGKRYFAAMAILVLSIFAFFVFPKSVLFITYLLVCSQGVAQIVEIIQRWLFYDILDSVEHVNIKQKMSIKDKIVVFMFNVPVDIDTRNLLIDRDISRNKLPWKDMFSSMLFVVMFCMFLWIYMFMNPTFNLGTEGVPIYTFTIILYLAAMMMPWTIYSTLNARIGTEYRDFNLYSGILGTFKRMFLPIFAAIIFLIIALSEGPDNLYYVGMSLVMIVLMVIFTSIMYYTMNETSVLKDILGSWEEFHSSTLYSDYVGVERRSSLNDGVPGTPRRNPSDCFVPIQKP